MGNLTLEICQKQTSKVGNHRKQILTTGDARPGLAHKCPSPIVPIRALCQMLDCSLHSLFPQKILESVEQFLHPSEYLSDNSIVGNNKGARIASLSMYF